MWGLTSHLPSPQPRRQSNAGPSLCPGKVCQPRATSPPSRCPPSCCLQGPPRPSTPRARGMFKVESSRFRRPPGTRETFEVRGFGFRVSCFGRRVSGSGFRDSSSGFQNSDFMFQVSGCGLQVPGFGFQISGFKFQVSGCGFRDAVFGMFQASGCGFQSGPCDDAGRRGVGTRGIVYQRVQPLRFGFGSRVSYYLVLVLLPEIAYPL